MEGALEFLLDAGGEYQHGGTHLADALVFGVYQQGPVVRTNGGECFVSPGGGRSKECPQEEYGNESDGRGGAHAGGFHWRQATPASSSSRRVWSLKAYSPP